MKRTVIAIFGVVLSSVATTPAKAASAVVGINVVHPQSLTVAQENDILDNLKAAGVHVIRTGITPDDKTIDFVKNIKKVGKSAIFIDHNIFHVYPVVDRLYVLDRGRVAGMYSKDEITMEELIERLYRVARSGKLE